MPISWFVFSQGTKLLFFFHTPHIEIPPQTAALFFRFDPNVKACSYGWHTPLVKWPKSVVLMHISGVTRQFSWGAEKVSVHHWPQDGTKQLCNLIGQRSSWHKLSFFHYPATSCGSHHVGRSNPHDAGQPHLCFISPTCVPSLAELSCLLPNTQDVD